MTTRRNSQVGSGKAAKGGGGCEHQYTLPGWWAVGEGGPTGNSNSEKKKKKRCRPSHGDHTHPEIGISDGRCNIPVTLCEVILHWITWGPLSWFLPSNYSARLDNHSGFSFSFSTDELSSWEMADRGSRPSSTGETIIVVRVRSSH